jgi:hypothetical protein
MPQVKQPQRPQDAVDPQQRGENQHAAVKPIPPEKHGTDQNQHAASDDHEPRRARRGESPLKSLADKSAYRPHRRPAPVVNVAAHVLDAPHQLAAKSLRLLQRIKNQAATRRRSLRRTSLNRQFASAANVREKDGPLTVSELVVPVSRPAVGIAQNQRLVSQSSAFRHGECARLIAVFRHQRPQQLHQRAGHERRDQGHHHHHGKQPARQNAKR